MAKAAEVFEQSVLSARMVREYLRNILINVETQRLQVWAMWKSDPEGADEKGRPLQGLYRTLCQEQTRLAAAVAAWEKAHPEGTDAEIEEKI